MQISKIGQGTGHKGEHLETYNKDFDSVVNNILAGVENGLTLIDTAEIYCEGRSEMIIGAATKDIRKEVKIASKFSPTNHKRDGVLNSIEGSMNRLCTDYIDLYQIHWPNAAVPLEETLTALFDLQEEGKILEVGVCNFNYSQLKNAMEFATSRKSRIYSAQIKFNLSDQFTYKAISSFCHENDIKIIAYSPLRNLLNQDNERLRVLTRIAHSSGMSPAQVALEWIISHRGVYAIPESSKLKHIKELGKVGQNPLDSRSITLLNQAFENIVENLEVKLIKSKNKKRLLAAPKLTRKEIQSFSLDFCPSITDLASEIEEGNFLQPILVRLDENDREFYEIVEGELRYWAFVYAFGANSEIPVIKI